MNAFRVVNMTTESCARHKGFQDAFCVTDVKERKKLLGKVLKIPEFNEEDDLRSGIGLDVHYDKLAYFVNSGFPWRGVTQLREVFQNLLNEVQGELLLSIRRSMSVFAAGNMCYLIMDSSLVKVVNTITLATYQTFFFWSWLTLYTIIAHCLNSFTV